MSSRAAAWLAWSLWALCVALVAITWLLALPAFWEVLFGVLVLTYSTVGAFVASRRPENPIGWIFCGAGLFVVFSLFLRVYTDYDTDFAPNFGGDPVTVAQYLAWLLDSLALVVIGLATVLLLLLFPDGRLPSGLLFPEGRLASVSWRAVVWTAVGGSVMAALEAAVQPSGSAFDNPLHIGGALGDFLGAMGVVGRFLLFVSGLFAAVALISRLTLARGEERQQLKWFAYAAAVMLGGLLAAPLLGSWSELMWDAGWFVGLLGFMFFPVATAIAILRYRLYDIDRIINRTLVYGSLTALLVLVYFAGVTATQSIFQTLTGQEQLPQLAIVASTLVIAALFNPLRRRLQSFIDRRFYRRKYDAAKTLEALLGQAARRDGSGEARRGPCGRGHRDYAAFPRLRVDAPRS